MQFKKYPSIRQFSDIVKHVKMKTDYQVLDDNDDAIFEHKEPYPVLSFSGTPKIHGTNAGIIIGDTIQVQSRSRSITIESDNAGFAAFVTGLTNLLNTLTKDIILYGEFCGKGIQKGVAVNELSKRFIIFNIYDIKTEQWYSPEHLNIIGDELQTFNDNNVFFLNQFPSFSICIDFNKPEQAQTQLEELTQEVEQECPVGKFFGITGVGEGIVWTHEQQRDLTFKVKGLKHQSTRTKSLAPVDVEKLNSINEFVERTCTKSRIEQGIHELKEQRIAIDKKSTGYYMKWIISDILKEESELLSKSGLCAKDVNKCISEKVRPFWFTECEKV